MEPARGSSDGLADLEMASQSSEEDPIAAALAASVEAGVVAGAATLVWCDGEVLQSAAVGCRDLHDRLPVERDTLFRIASMTKPITSTAALMLLEEGRVSLGDSITRWAP
jgi:CubicO group peptidase (beta-lactamase class C family)